MEAVNTTALTVATVQADFGYDPETRTFTQPLQPGKSIPALAMDWDFDIPQEKLHNPVVYNGGLRFTDADTGELLTFLPIRIVNGDLSTDSTSGGY
jgi:hypothetical protein